MTDPLDKWEEERVKRADESGRRLIKEEDGLHEAWFKEAKEMTLEKLPAFLKTLSEEYEHDYGTICHAIVAAAVGAAWAVEKCPSGGITGFQAGAIMWGFMQQWNGKEGPMSLLEYEWMLFPQYRYRFKTIHPDTWKWLQKRAGEELAKGSACNEVLTHMKSIVDGEVPFGFEVREEK